MSVLHSKFSLSLIIYFLQGFKWSVSSFKDWLAERESVSIMNETFALIDDLIIKTMIAAESEIASKLQSGKYTEITY
jgi:hypothetical protein